jgi:hypothetical protein
VLKTQSLSPPGTRAGTMAASSLCSAQSSNGMRCIAFALVSTSAAPLPTLEIVFALRTGTNAKDAVVNAWIVIAEPVQETAFLEGGPEGSVVVPACDPAVIGVAGVLDDGQMWNGSSRGPASQYETEQPDIGAPLMAHRPDGAGSPGTSFASPRAAGDIAEVLADSARRPNCTDAKAVVFETYINNKPNQNPPEWNGRYGYYKETTL